MSEEVFRTIMCCLFVAAIMFLIGMMVGRDSAREHFLTFCTGQKVEYSQCKEKWVRG